MSNYAKPYVADELGYIDKRFSELGLTVTESKLVYSICRKYTNKRDTLEDVLQNALIAIFNAFERYKSIGKVVDNKLGFINKVVTSSIIQIHINKHNRDIIYSSIYGNWESLVDNEDIRPILLDTKNNYKYLLIMDQIIKNLELPPKDEFIAYCYFILGMTSEEIGECLYTGSSPIFRKLKYIKQLLQEVVISDIRNE